MFATAELCQLPWGWPMAFHVYGRFNAKTSRDQDQWPRKNMLPKNTHFLCLALDRNLKLCLFCVETSNFFLKSTNLCPIRVKSFSTLLIIKILQIAKTLRSLISLNSQWNRSLIQYQHLIFISKFQLLIISIRQNQSHDYCVPSNFHPAGLHFWTFQQMIKW